MQIYSCEETVNAPLLPPLFDTTQVICVIQERKLKMSKFATLLVAGLFIAGNAIAQAPATPAAPAAATTTTSAKLVPVADSAKKDAAVKGEHKGDVKGEHKGDTKGVAEKKAAPETTKK